MLTLSVPLATLKVTLIFAVPASTSEIEMPLIAKVASSSTACAPGTVFAGPSFKALTVIATVSVSVNAPGAPVLPSRWSSQSAHRCR